MYPKSVPVPRHKIQNPVKHMLTNYSRMVAKTGHRSIGHTYWWTVPGVSHRATKIFVWAIRVFNEIRIYCPLASSKNDKGQQNFVKTAQRNDGEKLLLSTLTGPPVTHPHMYPKSVPHHIKIQTHARQMLTNYSKTVPKTGHRSRGHSHWWTVPGVSHRVKKNFVWTIKVFIENRIYRTALWYHTRMIKDNKNLFKTAQRNNGEKLSLGALTGSSVTHNTSLPSQCHITSKSKILRNTCWQTILGWCQKQDTVTDELSQVFHIERQELFGLSEYLLKIEYTALWYHRRMIKENKNLFKTAPRNNGEKLPLNALCDTSYMHPKSVPVPCHIESKILQNKCW